MRRLASLAVVLGSVAVCRLAAAESPPSVWARVAHPEAARAFELHRSVRDKLARDVEIGSGRSFAYESARIALEDANVEHSTDPVLLFDYGEILEALDEHEKAIHVLQQAMRLAPGHPAADDANLTLAFAYAKQDRSEEELEHYRAYVRSSRNLRGLSTAMLNMAEAEMRLGRLEDAVAGYRESYRLATEGQTGSLSQETAALACYGLAVALDRQGDASLGRDEMGRALAIDPGMTLVTSSPNVFFVPAYERFYYKGLGFEARARDTAGTLASRHEHLRRAVGAFTQYVGEARADDKWVYRAREHLAELAAWGKSLPPVPPPARAKGVRLPGEAEITF